jgi:DHA1 family tetracycline resistance protein-like MFS transporter
MSHQNREPALGFIFLTAVLDVLGFGLLIPVAPRLVESLLHGGQGGTAAEAAPWVGALQSTFFSMTFLFAPLLGVLSDRFGRRPVILLALLGSGLDYFAMALAPSLTWLFVTRMINGLSGGSFSVVNAYVSDVTKPERRATGFGLIGAAFGLGFVVGPVLGGILGAQNLRYPFWAAGGLTLINWLYGLFVLPESLPPERRSPISFKRANPIGAYAALGKHPFVAVMALSLFFLNLAQFGLHATWALSMQHRFEWSTKAIGLSLMVVGIGAAVVQGGLARRLIPKLGEPRSLILGLTISVVAYVGYGAATQGWMIYSMIAIASLAAISQPAGQALITKQVDATEQGAVQGALASLNSVAGILGPLIGGTTMAYFIHTPPPFPDFPVRLDGANFYVSAGLALLGTFVAAWGLSLLRERPTHLDRSTTLDR